MRCTIKSWNHSSPGYRIQGPKNVEALDWNAAAQGTVTFHSRDYAWFGIAGVCRAISEGGLRSCYVLQRLACSVGLHVWGRVGALYAYHFFPARILKVRAGVGEELRSLSTDVVVYEYSTGRGRLFDAHESVKDLPCRENLV